VAKQDSFSVIQKISELESIVGRLSPVQKMLLGTDGSVTSLLEILTGSPVEIETLAQEIIPADQAVAKELNLNRGEDVNYRVVKLKKAGTGETLIYAVSHTPLKRLEESFRDDLTRADIPIGVILKKHKMESRREINSAGFLQADRKLSQIFNIFPKELMLRRNYKIIRHGEPLISIEETFPYNSFQDGNRVVIETPSRIHLTLTDLTGASGRVDGGAGITLDEPGILIEAERGNELSVEGENPDRARAAAQAVMGRFGLGGARLTIREDYKMHVGLGRGTQIGIAAGKALCELYHKKVSVREIARTINRGGTSGIGTAAFDMGGFIIDGGHTFGPGKEKTDFRPSSVSSGIRPARVIAHHYFPQDWKILLAIPEVPRGAHGQQEVDIFKRYCPVPPAEVHELCYQILVRMLPSVVEEDLDEFGAAINRVQEIGFKRIEVMLQHPLVRSLMEEMRAAGAACTGLSSFGPTVFAITDTQARDIESAAHDAMRPEGGEVMITRARNEGARIRTI